MGFAEPHALSEAQVRTVKNVLDGSTPFHVSKGRHHQGGQPHPPPSSTADTVIDIQTSAGSGLKVHPGGASRSEAGYVSTPSAAASHRKVMQTQSGVQCPHMAADRARVSAQEAQQGFSREDARR